MTHRELSAEERYLKGMRQGKRVGIPQIARVLGGHRTSQNVAARSWLAGFVFVPPLNICKRKAFR